MPVNRLQPIGERVKANAAKIARRATAQSDEVWYMLLFLAAIEEVRDIDQALDLADQAIAEQPRPPEDL